MERIEGRAQSAHSLEAGGVIFSLRHALWRYKAAV